MVRYIFSDLLSTKTIKLIIFFNQNIIIIVKLFLKNKSVFEKTGQGIVWLDHVRCHGNESSLLDCEYAMLDRQNEQDETNVHVCTHAEEIGIACNTPNYGVHRKVNGNRAS